MGALYGPAETKRMQAVYVSERILKRVVVLVDSHALSVTPQSHRRGSYLKRECRKLVGDRWSSNPYISPRELFLLHNRRIYSVESELRLIYERRTEGVGMSNGQISESVP